MPEHKRGKSGTRKYGRNKAKCERYRVSRSVKNKVRKLHKHIANHPLDAVAQTALKGAYVVWLTNEKGGLVRATLITAS